MLCLLVLSILLICSTTNVMLCHVMMWWLFSECPITSITSPDPSSLLIKWNSYVGATNYFLDLRVVNATGVAPVVVTVPASSTQRKVQGLWPGTTYRVTLKVFQFYYVRCQDTQTSLTGNSLSLPVFIFFTEDYRTTSKNHDLTVLWH